jgi:conjugative transposon TraM protein
MYKVKRPSRLMAGRKQKMLLVLPILVVPFITLGFWALGGGKGNVQVAADKEGLNLHLPDPKLKKETILDKLGFYDKADKDSLRLAEEIQNDPYYRQPDAGTANVGRFDPSFLLDTDKLNTSPYHASADQSEKRLMQKLAALNRVIHQPPSPVVKLDDKDIQANVAENNIAQLEDMMQSLNQRNDSNAELQQLSSMMDKILDIQHPERMKEFIGKQAQQTAHPFTVNNRPVNDTNMNGFYGIDALPDTTKSNAIEAVVNENQSLVNGAVIKLRLISDAYIKDVKIPSGHFVYGTVSLHGERLKVEINSIRYGNSVYPVQMEVYDMDGLEGIYIPGAITRDVVKQSADNSLQTMELTSLDPSLAAQATAAGVGTVKNLFSKKAKLVKVMVKAGYKVLLLDKSRLL